MNLIVARNVWEVAWIAVCYVTHVINASVVPRAPNALVVLIAAAQSNERRKASLSKRSILLVITGHDTTLCLSSFY